MLANRILVREKSPREGLIDDGNVLGSGCVALFNRSSLQQAGADSLEIMGPDTIPGWRCPTIIRRFSLNEYAFVRVVAAERTVPGQAGAQDAGNLRQRLLKPLIEPIKLIRRVAGE